MTAIICAFSRAYHASVNEVTIYNDRLAEKILTADEYEQISNHMSDGIQFFNPNFSGNKQEALRWIVDHQLSPSPLGRARYLETILNQATQQGVTQYILLGAGYDTFSYQCGEIMPELKIFELDRAFTLSDKQRRFQEIGMIAPAHTTFVAVDFTEPDWIERLKNHINFSREEDCLISLLGLSYYLTRDSFECLIHAITELTLGNVTIVLDYPDENTYTEKAGDRTKKQVMMAQFSGEKMQDCYALSDMELLLNAHGFDVMEQLTPEQITNTLFREYNVSNPTHKMTAFDNVNYCCAVRKRFR